MKIPLPDNFTPDTVLTVLATARDLVSEHGENPEYDRALVELTCYLLGLSTDYKQQVARIIGLTGSSLAALS